MPNLVISARSEHSTPIFNQTIYDRYVCEIDGPQRNVGNAGLQGTWRVALGRTYYNEFLMASISLRSTKLGTKCHQPVAVVLHPQLLCLRHQRQYRSVLLVQEN